MTPSRTIVSHHITSAHVVNIKPYTHRSRLLRAISQCSKDERKYPYSVMNALGPHSLHVEIYAKKFITDPMCARSFLSSIHRDRTTVCWCFFYGNYTRTHHRPARMKAVFSVLTSSSYFHLNVVETFVNMMQLNIERPRNLIH